MSEKKPNRDFTAHQQKIIKRYYNNLDGIAGQRLAERSTGEVDEPAAVTALAELGLPHPQG